MDIVQPKIIVTGQHTEETRQRFRNLPSCRVIFAEKTEDIRPEDLADAQIFVGAVSRELVKQMP